MQEPQAHTGGEEPTAPELLTAEDYGLNTIPGAPLAWTLCQDEGGEGHYLRGFFPEEPRCSIFIIWPLSPTTGFLRGAFLFDGEEQDESPVEITILEAKAIDRTKSFLAFALPLFGIRSGPLTELLLNGGGLAEIVRERREQVGKHGNRVSVDAGYTHNELVRAATAYANAQGSDAIAPEDFPWPPQFWRPKDRVANLAIAGALIAAEIDAEQWRQRYPLGAGTPMAPPDIREAFMKLHTAWLGAGHRSDMNEEMDALACKLGLDPLNPGKALEETRVELSDLAEAFLVGAMPGGGVTTTPEAAGRFLGLEASIREIVVNELLSHGLVAYEPFNRGSTLELYVTAKGERWRSTPAPDKIAVPPPVDEGLQCIKDEATGQYLGSWDRWLVQVGIGEAMNSSWEYAMNPTAEPLRTTAVKSLARVYTGQEDLAAWLRIANAWSRGEPRQRLVFNLYHE